MLPVEDVEYLAHRRGRFAGSNAYHEAGIGPCQLGLVGLIVDVEALDQGSNQSLISGAAGRAARSSSTNFGLPSPIIMTTSSELSLGRPMPARRELRT